MDTGLLLPFCSILGLEFFELRRTPSKFKVAAGVKKTTKNFVLILPQKSNNIKASKHRAYLKLTMEFEYAAQRLEREQSKLKGRNHNNVVSVKAKREADFRKRQQQLMKEKREREQIRNDHVLKVWTNSERSLGVRELSPGGLLLNATSIHGDGDKIALPPSVLERLTRTMDSEGSASPWTFRVGILNPNYTFPASIAMQNIKAPREDAMEEDSDDEEHDGIKEQTEYLEELSHKYIAYSHASVVEFTQEEGHVGLPASIAKALLDPKRKRIQTKDVKSIRTKDPAISDDGTIMDAEEERTPGHLAWGAFDLPDLPLEISLVTLPKGSGCTLVPTMEAIRHGFHQLKDVKLVLEQSLVRTRATLSIGDTVHTWHRGSKFDLTVTSVTPADFYSISCINTDVEVDIGANEEAEQYAAAAAVESTTTTNNGRSLVGQILSESTTASSGQTLPGNTLSESTSTTTIETTPAVAKTPILDLRPEPPADQTEGICTIQIRADKASGRRRFDVNVATVQDLFAFAATMTNNEESFQLVTRFPRRVLTVQDTVLSSSGIQAGQELFLVEKL
jgi:hypothetical protein